MKKLINHFIASGPIISTPLGVSLLFRVISFFTERNSYDDLFFDWAHYILFLSFFISVVFVVVGLIMYTAERLKKRRYVWKKQNTKTWLLRGVRGIIFCIIFIIVYIFLYLIGFEPLGASIH